MASSSDGIEWRSVMMHEWRVSGSTTERLEKRQRRREKAEKLGKAVTKLAMLDQGES